MPASGNYIYLASEMGELVPDFIGAGKTYLYTTGMKEHINVELVDGKISLQVLSEMGGLMWSGDFVGMDGLKPLQPGHYSNAHRYPFQAKTESGMAIGNSILSRACNQLNGWFAIDRLEYENGQPVVLDLRFEQHCEGHVPALHGQIHWEFDRTPRPPIGPIAPPAGLWQAPASVLPTEGNYIYLASDLGNYAADYYGRPFTGLYTSRDAGIKLEQTLAGALFRIRGDEFWTGHFEGPPGKTRLQTGYYGDMSSVWGAERGMLAWDATRAYSAGARTGGVHRSWFMIDSVTYENERLVALDARFAQHGGGLRPALRGQVHWRADDTLIPPGPINPPPAGLWRPPANVIPASGTYLYLEGDPGEFISAGQTYRYTPDNATFGVRLQDDGVYVNNGVHVKVSDHDSWHGTFVPLEMMKQLQPGYYAGLRGAPYTNPAKGGLDWGGHSRGCNHSTGWFVVDHVAYDKGDISALELRFEQRCVNDQNTVLGAMRGALRWTK